MARRRKSRGSELRRGPRRFRSRARVQRAAARQSGPAFCGAGARGSAQPLRRVLRARTTNTTVGWWTSGAGDSTRSAAEIANERRYCLDYLGLRDGAAIHWQSIRALMRSVADTVVFPAQDLLGLDGRARMNMPSTIGGNWRWRLEPGAMTPGIAGRLREMTLLYNCLPS